MRKLPQIDNYTYLLPIREKTLMEYRDKLAIAVFADNIIEIEMGIDLDYYINKKLLFSKRGDKGMLSTPHGGIEFNFDINEFKKALMIYYVFSKDYPGCRIKRQRTRRFRIFLRKIRNLFFGYKRNTH